jgi:hypothetical protein
MKNKRHFSLDELRGVAQAIRGGIEAGSPGIFPVADTSSEKPSINNLKDWLLR